MRTKIPRLLLLLLFFALLCRLLYPHTRFGFQYTFTPGAVARLNIKSATLKPGDKVTLRLTGIRKMARYSSSDFRIAYVTPGGTVHALSPGVAIISVTQGDDIYKCRITVAE